jgi:Zn-dependent oligopeptidase
MVTLQAPSIWPFLSYAVNRELRRQILTACTKRCDNGNGYDNTQVLYRSLGSVPRDFVELPSQIMENWPVEPDVEPLLERRGLKGGAR